MAQKKLEELWSIVNSVITLEEIHEAKIILDGVGDNITNSEYDDLMSALASLSREAYRRERG